MAKFGSKRTFVALSVATAIASTAVNAATFEEYNYSGAKAIKGQASKKNEGQEAKIYAKKA